MFDIGFWELALLGVIGLIVLGPERLPVVARTLGRWVAQARHYMHALTSELEKEVEADELRREVRQAREQIESETRQTRDQASGSVEPVMRSLKDGLSRDAAETSSHRRAAAGGDTPAHTTTDRASTASPSAPEPQAAATTEPGEPAVTDRQDKTDP